MATAATATATSLYTLNHMNSSQQIKLYTIHPDGTRVNKTAQKLAIQVYSILHSRNPTLEKPTNETIQTFIQSHTFGRSYLCIYEPSPTQLYSGTLFPVAYAMCTLNVGEHSNIVEVYDWMTLNDHKAKGSGKKLIEFIITHHKDYLIWFGQADPSPGLELIYTSLKDCNGKDLFSIPNSIQSPLGITLKTGLFHDPFRKFTSWFAINNYRDYQQVKGYPKGSIVSDLQDIIRFTDHTDYNSLFRISLPDDFHTVYFSDILGTCTSTTTYTYNENAYVMVYAIQTPNSFQTFGNIIQTNTRSFVLPMKIISSSRLTSVHRTHRLHTPVHLKTNVLDGHSHPLGIYSDEHCGVGWPSILDLTRVYDVIYPYHFVMSVEGIYIISANLEIPTFFNHFITKHLPNIPIDFEQFFPDVYNKVCTMRKVQCVPGTRPFYSLETYRQLDYLYVANVIPTDHYSTQSSFDTLIRYKNTPLGIQTKEMNTYINQFIRCVESITLDRILAEEENDPMPSADEVDPSKYPSLRQSSIFRIQFSPWKFTKQSGELLNGFECKTPYPADLRVTLEEPDKFILQSKFPSKLLTIPTNAILQYFNAWRTGAVHPLRPFVNITPNIMQRITDMTTPQFQYNMALNTYKGGKRKTRKTRRVHTY